MAASRPAALLAVGQSCHVPPRSVAPPAPARGIACAHALHMSLLHLPPAGKQSVTTNRPVLSTVAELKSDIAAQTGGGLRCISCMCTS